MDENSCENETSESADGQKAKETEDAPPLENVGIRLNIGPKPTGSEIKNRGSSFDGSGPSGVFPPVRDDNSENTGPVIIDAQKTKYSGFVRKTQCELVGSVESITDSTRELWGSGTSVARSPRQPKKTSDRVEYAEVPELRRMAAIENTPPTLPQYEERQEFQPRVRLAPSVVEQLATRRPSVGPPPSYSFVMKQKKKQKLVQQPVESLVISNPPPPSYTGSRGVFIPPEERICNFPSFADPIWRSHSQPALCPRCGIIVLTTTHTHDSIATHVAALALCLFGCWPCCLIPYCMNVCKNTYHHCPICQTFLGLYKPW